MSVIKVPVLIGFNHEQPIGFMEVDTDKLPKTPNFCFSIGYHARAMRDGKVEDADIVCVSLVSDEEYAKVLQHTGVVK